MRYLELRRHTMRDKDNPQINQAGLDLARRVGLGMGPYARVVSSPQLRAVETAIAMGFAVTELYEPVQEQLKKKRCRQLEKLLPLSLAFRPRAKILQEEKAGRRYGDLLLSQWTDLARRTPNGKTTLVITHGGYIEDSAIACLPAVDHRRWGPNFAYCEGILLTFDRGYFKAGQLLRV